jgi:hypothetical protein
MTADQFRSSTERVTEWRELLASNPLVAQVIVVLRDEKPSAIVAPGSDALDRAAALARLEQHETDVNLLLSLAEPLPVETPDEDPTWGLTQEQIDQLKTKR